VIKSANMSDDVGSQELVVNSGMDGRITDSTGKRSMEELNGECTRKKKQSGLFGLFICYYC